MNMKRREFSLSLLAAGLGNALPAAAQGGAWPVEGTNYVRLSQPVPVSAPAGKIETIEFFWYGCPHCNAFEPTLDAWQKSLPPDVFFRRVPVAFSEEPYGTHQKIFYALDALGLIPTMHRKVFYAIHGERVRMRTPEDFTAFALKNGVDPLKFIEAYNSFGVQSKALQARQIASALMLSRGTEASGRVEK